MLDSLEKYIRLFGKLKRAYQHGGAPHKPILLLAILKSVESKVIISNRIYITPELIMNFRELWSKLVTTQHQLNFALPFFHMRTEPFWRLVNKPGNFIPLTSSHSIKSLGSLNENIQYAEIDQELWDLMLNAQTNLTLTKLLLSTYFSESSNVTLEYGELHEIEHQIMNDDQYTYKARILDIENNYNNEQGQEILYIRCGIFKREIPKIYNYTCAISKMRIATSSNAQLVDACHIVPFSVSKNDTITNGISLCPNLHRAFDRGLITIDSNYRVKVSPKLTEDDSPYS
ncbi:MAG: HNH endonuclease, partial [Bacteroidia bacterium]|nr:HNH endonuclease [Bacteroidia bacterium]